MPCENIDNLHMWGVAVVVINLDFDQLIMGHILFTHYT